MEQQQQESARKPDAEADAEMIVEVEAQAEAEAKAEAEAEAKAEADAKVSVEQAPPQNTQKMIHTRSCNRREVCSCFLRLQSAYFQKNLVAKRRKKQKEPKNEDDSEEKMADGMAAAAAGALVTDEADGAVAGDENVQTTPAKKKKRPTGNRRTYRVVTNLQRFEIEVKQLIAMFLKPVELAKLSMASSVLIDRHHSIGWAMQVSRTMRSEVETIAEIGTRELVSSTELVLKHAKPQSESWARYLHVQMNSVRRLLVYYTGYKTSQMRRDYAHWTFGLVEIDPNDPSQVVLPNTWKFHEHEPWQRKRANGKDGEWLLRPGYKRGRAPKVFGRQVKEWAINLRPGSFVAVAYQNVGSEEPAWWEAQVWYVWRTTGRLDPAIVLDAQNETTMEIHPDDLLEHFKVLIYSNKPDYFDVQ